MVGPPDDRADPRGLRIWHLALLVAVAAVVLTLARSLAGLVLVELVGCVALFLAVVLRLLRACDEPLTRLHHRSNRGDLWALLASWAFCLLLVGVGVVVTVVAAVGIGQLLPAPASG